MPIVNAEIAWRRSLVWSLDLAWGFGSAKVALAAGEYPYRFNELGLGFSLTKEWTFGRLAPYVGGRLALVYLMRDFEDPGVPKQSYFAMTPGLVVGLRLQLASHWALGARVRGHYLYYAVDTQQSLGYLEGALVLSVEL
jgi:hypothetical protein